MRYHLAELSTIDISLKQAFSSSGSMVGLGAGANGALGLSHIAREILNLRRAGFYNKRAPDARVQLQRAQVTQQCPLERGTPNGGVKKVSGEKGI